MWLIIRESQKLLAAVDSPHFFEPRKSLVGGEALIRALRFLCVCGGGVGKLKTTGGNS